MKLAIISTSKTRQLEKRMEALGIKEEDFDEQFVRGQGKGGQKINKTSSCVVLVHKKTDIVIKCQKDRSQAMNRFFARRELCERLEERSQEIKSARQKKIEKIRRQKRRRSRRQKSIMLDEKRKQGQKKEQRRTISDW